MSRLIEIPFKSGSTFSLAFSLLLPAGTWTAKADVKTLERVLVEHLHVSIAAPDAPEMEHIVLLTADYPQTALWPRERLISDILFLSDGIAIRSASFFILNSEGITDG